MQRKGNQGYDYTTTTVRCAAELTDEFTTGVGLHQGSALSPFLFAIIMEKLTEDIRKEAPGDMTFADYPDRITESQRRTWRFGAMHWREA